MEDQPKKQNEIAANDTLATFRNIEEVQAFGDKIAQTGMVSKDLKGKDIVAAIILGRELGLPPMVSIINIYPINGRGTLSVHAINAILQKNGVIVEKIRDYEPCMLFALKGDDGKAVLFDNSGNVVPRDANGGIPKDATGNNLGNPFVLREGFADESPRDNEVKATKISNFKTVLRFTRYIKQPFGMEPVKHTIESSFSRNEGIQADLIGNPKKENWVKYEKQMVFNRALAFGGRVIGGDLMLGMYETSEMLDTTDTPYKVTNGGENIEIIHNKEESKNMNTSSMPVAEEVIAEDTSKENVKI